MKFYKFLKSINSEFEDILLTKYPVEDLQLNTDLALVKGNQFYKVLVLLTNDFNTFCERGLSEIATAKKKKYLLKQNKKTNLTSKTNNFQEFINQFITLQLDIAHNAGIDNTRFTKILNLTADDFYAYEVYSLAISQGLSLEKAFEQLYKNLPLKTGKTKIAKTKYNKR